MSLLFAAATVSLAGFSLWWLVSVMDSFEVELAVLGSLLISALFGVLLAARTGSFGVALELTAPVFFFLLLSPLGCFALRGRPPVVPEKLEDLACWRS